MAGRDPFPSTEEIKAANADSSRWYASAFAWLLRQRHEMVALECGGDYAEG
jgi:hypothetical protein